jgi:hypothetical protein
MGGHVGSKGEVAEGNTNGMLRSGGGIYNSVGKGRQLLSLWVAMEVACRLDVQELAL